MPFTSHKLFEGYSACFRQWKADETHCKYLHGYAVSFSVTFEGELDKRNWVFDFGGMKRARHKITFGGNEFSPNEFFAWLFDHTTIVAEDDPELEMFKELNKKGIIQLRILPYVGCERFAEFLFNTINLFLYNETNGRVIASKVTVYENNKNSATFKF
jgi:6-pyruvoyltetrahydropterin/6-carboxytetrahydropterin synthase